jgi:flagellar biogenesis protein FliO
MNTRLLAVIVAVILILAVIWSVRKVNSLSSGQNTWSVTAEQVLEMGR